MKLATLKFRREFLRVRGGGRAATHAFVLEGKPRPPQADADTANITQTPDVPRFGFTVTKMLGNAVVRNRIRRRLKAAIGQVANAAARDHFDYVVIARPAARDMAFLELTALFAKAFERVHGAGRAPNPGGPKNQRKAIRRTETGSQTPEKNGDDANKSRTVTR